MTLRHLLTATALSLAACGDPPAPPPPPPPPPPVDAGFIIEMVRPRNVDATLIERTPDSFAMLSLPMGAQPAVPYVDGEGNGYVVTRDARFLRVNAYGAVTALERLAGDRAGTMEAPPNAVVELSVGEPMALVPDGALVVRDGSFRRAALPALLSNARATTRWGSESLWATGTGLYTTQGVRWLRLDRNNMPLTDVTAVVPGVVEGTTRDAWVLRANGELYRLRVTLGAGDTINVGWHDAVPGYNPGMVRAIAGFGGHRYMARQGDLVRVDARGELTRVRVPGMYAGPVAMAASGPWLWIVWTGGPASVIGRYDGTRFEALGRAIFATNPRIAVDATRGDIALLLDGDRVRRVVAEAGPVVTGFADGAAVTEARLAFQVDPPTPQDVMQVEFTLDGMRLERLNAPPFRWGMNNELFRSFPALAFGEHTAEAVIAYRGAPELRVRRSFRYLSPLGRVPTYRGDIAMLYNTACARCHSTGIARDLRGYMRLSEMAPIVAAVVQSRRMPPDLMLDSASIQLMTSWVAGSAPE
jgi:hypothetical protein